MKLKRMWSATAAAVLAAGLGGSSAATAQAVDWNVDTWEIVAESPADAVFQCDSKPMLETSIGLEVQSGTLGPFEIGVHENGDFPGLLRAGDVLLPDPALNDVDLLNSCEAVTVQYSLGGEGEPLSCANTQIVWERDGLEVDAVSHDGSLLGNAMGLDEVTSQANNFAVPGIQLPGTYEIRIQATLTNMGDGLYAPQSLALSCDPLCAFAKISGGVQDPDVPAGGRGNKKGLKDPTHAFQGVVGLLASDGSITGEIRVNYRDAFVTPAECVFSPGVGGTLVIDAVDGTATLTGWEFTCEDDELSPTMGTATLVLVGRDGSGTSPKKGHNKDRGSLCIDADVDDLDLGDAAVACYPLDRGNLIVGGDCAAAGPDPAPPAS